MDATQNNRQSSRLRTDGNQSTPSTSRAAGCRVMLPQYMDDDDLLARRQGRRHRLRNNPCSGGGKPIIVRRALASLQHANANTVYRLTSRPKGLFVMINNINFESPDHRTREGADKDQVMLMNLFRKLGYRVECWKNQTYQEMQTKVGHLSRRPDLTRVDSVFVAVGSHGEGRSVGDTGIVSCREGDPLLQCRWLVDQLDAGNCEAMNEKPKVFLFQVCRGGLNDSTSTAVFPRRDPTQPDGNSPSESSRLKGDILEAYASVQGFVALRHSELGSWFFQAVCKVYSQRACEDDIATMHNQVDDLIKHCKSNDAENAARQTSTYLNVGFKKFYFYPGEYHERAPMEA